MKEDSLSVEQLQIFENPYPIKNKVKRMIWNWVWTLFFRPSPRLLFSWRNFLLRLFGAQIGKGVHVYPSAKIWAPWNLELRDFAGLGDYVDCYCVAKITIGRKATVSQYSYLCSASHDISDPSLRLTSAPIVISDGAWVFADAFIGPGVTIGEGAVVGARASVFKDVDAWVVVGGNPARFIKKRVLRD